MNLKQLQRLIRYDGELRFSLERRRLCDLRHPSFLHPLLRRMPRVVGAAPLRVPRIRFARYPVTDMRIVRDTTPFLGAGFRRARVRFSHPYGVAIEKNGDFIVADTFKNRVLLFDAQGAVRGRIHHAREGRIPLNMPMCAAFTSSGDILVLNSGVGMLHRFDRTGRYIDDPTPADRSLLIGARGLCAGRNGTVFVCATRRHKVLALSSSGNRLKEFNQSDLGQWPYAFPMGVAQSDSGEIAVCDTFNHRVVVFDGDGRRLHTLGGLGLEAGRFNGPGACAFAGGGILLVLEWAGNRIQAFDDEGRVTGGWGRSGSWLLGREIGELSWAGDLAVDGSRAEVLVADTHNHRIQRFTLDSILSHAEKTEPHPVTAAPPPGSSSTTPGRSSVTVEFTHVVQLDTALKSPQGLTAVGSGEIWIADTFHNRMVRWLRPDGECVAFGGLGKGREEFINPTDSAAAGDQVYVVDSLNSRLHRYGKCGDPRGIVRELPDLLYPRSIAFETAGGFAIAETVPGRLSVYDADFRLRWTLGQDSGHIQHPSWVRWFRNKLYVVDIGLHRTVVFREDGRPLQWWGGLVDQPPGLNHPNAMVIAADRLCIVADAGNHRLQFYTLDGEWLRDWQGDTEESRLFYPRGLLWREKEQQLIVADSERHRLVKLDVKLEV